MVFCLEQKLLTINEVAEYLQISEVTLKKWVKNNDIPYYRVGKNFRFKRSDLDEWLKTLYQLTVAQKELQEDGVAR